MTEDEARDWIRECWGVSRETRLAALVRLVRDENGRQNLISPSTIDRIWARHVADSAQLLTLAGDRCGAWLDIGTGAGFPGLVIACLRQAPITLCEPRKRRADFLSGAVTQLGLGGEVEIAACRAEKLSGNWAIISARAVAPLTDLLAAGQHVASRSTIWLLPKGRGAREEVATARQTWHGSFHVEQSITQPGSMIVVATAVVRR